MESLSHSYTVINYLPTTNNLEIAVVVIVVVVEVVAVVVVVYAI
jgi:hypothetical protein